MLSTAIARNQLISSVLYTVENTKPDGTAWMKCDTEATKKVSPGDQNYFIICYSTQNKITNLKE